MIVNTQAIRRRALKFMSTLPWRAAVIIEVLEARAALVTRVGSGNVSEYRTFRIEVNHSDEIGTITIDVTCSAANVIHSEFRSIHVLNSIGSFPLINNVSRSNVTPEPLERYEPMRLRALAYVGSTNWVEPIILQEQEPESLIVESLGSGDLAAYRNFRIEVWEPENKRVKVLSAAPDAPKTARYLDAPINLDITCSATDVIQIVSDRQG